MDDNSIVYKREKKSLYVFGQVFSCCCLQLLPQLVFKILATMYKDLSQLGYLVSSAYGNHNLARMRNQRNYVGYIILVTLGLQMNDLKDCISLQVLEDRCHNSPIDPPSLPLSANNVSRTRIAHPRKKDGKKRQEGRRKGCVAMRRCCAPYPRMPCCTLCDLHGTYRRSKAT